MTFCINYPEDKFNVILSILLQHKIVVIVLRPPAACRRFSPDQGDRWLAAKPVIVSVILISALCATLDQRFQVLQLPGDRSGSLSGVSAWCLLYRPVFSWSGATRLKDIVLIG
jgi:hypothetical protein